MPVIFYIDPKMLEDPNMEDVESMTLSYTFYETGTPALDRALDQISQLPRP
jgi:cytochrome c oxidase assembly protein subunit 11